MKLWYNDNRKRQGRNGYVKCCFIKKITHSFDSGRLSKSAIHYRNIVAAMDCAFYKVPGHPFVICDYGNGSGSYFFMEFTKSKRIIIKDIM